MSPLKAIVYLNIKHTKTKSSVLSWGQIPAFSCAFHSFFPWSCSCLLLQTDIEVFGEYLATPKVLFNLFRNEIWNAHIKQSHRFLGLHLHFPWLFVSPILPWNHCDCKEVDRTTFSDWKHSEQWSKGVPYFAECFWYRLLKVPCWDDEVLPFLRLQNCKAA